MVIKRMPNLLKSLRLRLKPLPNARATHSERTLNPTILSYHFRECKDPSTEPLFLLLLPVYKVGENVSPDRDKMHLTPKILVQGKLRRLQDNNWDFFQLKRVSPLPRLLTTLPSPYRHNKPPIAI